MSRRENLDSLFKSSCSSARLSIYLSFTWILCLASYQTRVYSTNAALNDVDDDVRILGLKRLTRQ